MRGHLGGLLVPDVELHPDRLRADLDRLLDVRHDQVRAPEEVDDLDALPQVGGRSAQVRMRRQAVDLRLRRG